MSIAAAALTAPITSMASSPDVQPRPIVDDCPVKVITGNGYSGISYPKETLIQTEHIPPMDIEGGGSLTIDSHNQLQHSRSSPYIYTEPDDLGDDYRYGDIVKAHIIAELGAYPWITFASYSFAPGDHVQLLLWYQLISASEQGDNDTTFPPVTYPDNDPDIRIVGGAGANKFQMKVKSKKFSTGKSHKGNRPHRFQHTQGGVLGRHFRIGQWRFLRSDNTLIVGDSGAENYKLYLAFGDIQ